VDFSGAPRSLRRPRCPAGTVPRPGGVERPVGAPAGDLARLWHERANGRRRLLSTVPGLLYGAGRPPGTARGRASDPAVVFPPVGVRPGSGPTAATRAPPVPHLCRSEPDAPAVGDPS